MDMVELFVARERIYVTETGRVDFTLKFQPLMLSLTCLCQNYP